jgi:hypothetical protein
MEADLPDAQLAEALPALPASRHSVSRDSDPHRSASRDLYGDSFHRRSPFAGLTVISLRQTRRQSAFQESYCLGGLGGFVPGF